jgi:predicted alpha/beta-hydrolase family hydrolase
MPEELQIAVGDERVGARRYRAPGARTRLILAHGAGADQRHPFLVRYAEGLAARGIEVVTFNFLYTEKRRRAPDPNDALERCYRAVVEAVRGLDPPGKAGEARHARLALGGKSMGGRIASQVAAAGIGPLLGLVFLGYPLHPPGKPKQLRSAHLSRVGAPMLFVQGERDPFGGPDELAPIVGGIDGAEIFAVAGGDHSLAVLKRSGVAQADVDAAVQNKIAAWLDRR